MSLLVLCVLPMNPRPVYLCCICIYGSITTTTTILMDGWIPVRSFKLVPKELHQQCRSSMLHNNTRGYIIVYFVRYVPRGWMAVTEIAHSVSALSVGITHGAAVVDKFERETVCYVLAK